MPQAPAAFQQTVWNPILDPTTLARGASTSIIALLLDFKNGIYQQTRTRTNLLLQSQAMATAPWSNADFPANTVLTNNAGVAPDGTNTATSVSPGVQYGNTRQSVSGLVTGATYTYSVWVKWVSGNTALTLNDNNASQANDHIIAITATANWQRFSYSFVNSNNSAPKFYVQDRNASGFGTFLVWGAQLEAAPAASDYIPTTSAAVSVTESITDQTKLVTNTAYPSTPAATGWGHNANSTYVVGAVLSPFGTMAGQVTAIAGGTNNLFVSNSNVMAAGPATVSCVAKKAAGTNFVVFIAYDSAHANGYRAWFDLTTGAVSGSIASGSSTGNAYSVSLGNGWYQLVINLTIPMAGSFSCELDSAQSSGNYAAVAGDSFYMDSAQATNTATLQSPIPSTTAPATVGAVTNLYGYTYSRSGAKEEVGTTYGPELVTNGGFDTNTNGWFSLNSATFTSANGELVVTGNGGSYQGAGYSISLVVGKTYLLTATGREGTTTGGCVVRFASSATTFAVNNSTTVNQTGTLFFTATQASDQIYALINSGTSTGTAVFDNISVKEVIPASSFAANVPAIIPGTGYFARPGYTNLQLWSQDFTNANWSKASVTIATGQIAPDGSSTAANFSNTVNVNSSFSYNVPISLSTTYTRSVYAKAVSGTNLIVLECSDGVTTTFASFNVATGVITSAPSVGTAAITSVGNGWYRCAWTFTTAASGTPYASSFYVAAYGSTATATTITLWQAQLVQASDPGPIIVTTSGTAAVGADAMNLPPTITADQDFILAAVATLSPVTAGFDRRIFSLNDGTNTNRIVVQMTTANLMGFFVISGGAGQTVNLSSIPATTAGRVVWLIRRRAGVWTMVQKIGSTLYTDALGSANAGGFPPSITKMDIGHFTNGAQNRDPVEFISVRPGTFSDADLTNILTAL